MVAAVSVLEHKGVGTLQRTRWCQCWKMAVLEHGGVGTQRCRNTTGKGTTITSLVLVLCKEPSLNIFIGMASWSVFLPPEHFNVARPEEWPKRICKFKRFRDASDLDEKSEQKQVSSLIYAMGEEMEDMLRSFRLTKDERKSYTTVRCKFQSFFVKRRNIAYEQCRFNLRR